MGSKKRIFAGVVVLFVIAIATLYFTQPRYTLVLSKFRDQTVLIKNGYGTLDKDITAYDEDHINNKMYVVGACGFWILDRFNYDIKILPRTNISKFAGDRLGYHIQTDGHKFVVLHDIEELNKEELKIYQKLTNREMNFLGDEIEFGVAVSH